MNNIVIGFSTPKSFNVFSTLIRLVDGSKFSHAYIRIFDDYAKRWIIYQASGLVVNCISASEFDLTEKVCSEFEVPISDTNRLQAIQFSIDMLGKPYGVKTIIGICLVKLAGIFRKRIKNIFSDGEKSLVCSKFCSLIIDHFVLESDDIDPEVSTPTDVYNFLISKGFSLKN